MSMNHIIIRQLPLMTSVFIFFSEAVSKPNMSWNCTNRTLTCQGTGGTDPKLKLYQNGNRVREDQKIIVHKWSNLNTVQFECTASNDVSKESRTEKIKCSGVWQVLVRRPKLMSQTQPARPTAEVGCRAQVPNED